MSLVSIWFIFGWCSARMTHIHLLKDETYYEKVVPVFIHPNNKIFSLCTSSISVSTLHQAIFPDHRTSSFSVSWMMSLASDHVLLLCLTSRLNSRYFLVVVFSVWGKEIENRWRSKNSCLNGFNNSTGFHFRMVKNVMFLLKVEMINATGFDEDIMKELVKTVKDTWKLLS